MLKGKFIFIFIFRSVKKEGLKAKDQTFDDENFIDSVEMPIEDEISNESRLI